MLQLKPVFHLIFVQGLDQIKALDEGLFSGQVMDSWPCFAMANWNKSCFSQTAKTPIAGRQLESNVLSTNKTMPSFAYTARETATGREIRSTVEAATEQAAIAALLNRNLLVVSIQEKVAKKGKTKGGKVSLADLVVFTRQLATMIDAGIAIVQSLQALADQTPNKVMRDVDPGRLHAGGKRRKLFRGAAKASQGVQPALRFHGGGGRKRRFAGGNSGAAGHLPGKHRPPPQKGQNRHDVSRRR